MNKKLGTICIAVAESLTMRLSKSALISLLLSLFPLAAGAISLDKPAPPLETRLLNGGHYALADHRGEVVILNFWATWCAPCRLELPVFAASYQAHHHEGLSVLAISLDDPEAVAEVREVAKDFSFPVSLYGDANGQNYGRIWRLPMTFIIDRRGVLRVDGGRGAGIVYDSALLEKTVGALLAEPRPDVSPQNP